MRQTLPRHKNIDGLFPSLFDHHREMSSNDPSPSSVSDQTNKVAKKAYQKPVLTEFGHIRELTKGLSGMANEMSAAANRRP